MRHGADAVLTYLIVGTGDAEFEMKEITRNAEVARECERVGIPLIVESLARGKLYRESPGDPKWLNLHTRMAAELGADAVKTDYSGDTASMCSVVEKCTIPILVLGGSRHATEKHALDVVREVAAAGAAGVFFGRNVFQADNISAFLEQARAALATERGRISGDHEMTTSGSRVQAVLHSKNVMDGRPGFRLRADWGSVSALEGGGHICELNLNACAGVNPLWLELAMGDDRSIRVHDCETCS